MCSCLISKGAPGSKITVLLFVASGLDPLVSQDLKKRNRAVTGSRHTPCLLTAAERADELVAKRLAAVVARSPACRHPRARYAIYCGLGAR